MLNERCFSAVCFIPLDPNGPRIFGFSEFLAGLALMVLAWTIGDIRYRFRIQTAPIALQGVTFTIVAALGILTLLTDLWRAQGWLVPEGDFLTPATWQALLAGLFLVTFLSWAWFAFIRRPTYGKRNAERFATTLYRLILKGNPAELAVIADELTYSAKALVQYATNRGDADSDQQDEDSQRKPLTKVVQYANDMLLLMADKRLCRVIVESSPGTALAIFAEIGETKKYRIQIDIFAKNIVREALLNTNSFLYHEAEGYESGLLGYHKPLSQAMFGNLKMVESISTLLDPDYTGKEKWGSAQWEAYCRLVLIALGDSDNGLLWSNSIILYRAKDYIESAVSDLYKLNNLPSTWETDEAKCLQVIMKFIWSATQILDSKGVPDHIRRRVREKHGHPRESFYDHIASMIYEIIFSASSISSPQWECWSIQHNTIWSRMRHQLSGPAGQIIRFKLHRLLYDEIADMSRFPNFKGARILSYCLNVMGLQVRTGSFQKDSRPLHKAIISWTKKNYVTLQSTSPRVAEACLVDGITFDADNLQLVKISTANALRNQPNYIYLKLDPAQNNE